MKNNPLISRIVPALIIGVLTGCIIVFFFPNDFFVSHSITSNRHLPVAVPKTQVSFSSKINYHLSCFSFFFKLCLLLNFNFLHVAWFLLTRNLTLSSYITFLFCVVICDSVWFCCFYYMWVVVEMWLILLFLVDSNKFKHLSFLFFPTMTSLFFNDFLFYFLLAGKFSWIWIIR